MPENNLQANLDEIKRYYIEEAMSRANGRKTVAVKLPGIANQQTLGKRMKALGLEQADARWPGDRSDGR